MKILGIELGSTRIKAVLIDENANVIANGVSEWENELVDGFWSYPMSAVKSGMQEAYANLVKNYGQAITTVDKIGISAMMHGYLAFDKDWNLLWQKGVSEKIMIHPFVFSIRFCSFEKNYLI